MKIYIRNIISLSCKEIIRQNLILLEFTPIKISSYYAEVKEKYISPLEINNLALSLAKFEIFVVEDHKRSLIDQIKFIVNESINKFDRKFLSENQSKYLEDQTSYTYSYISKQFSRIENQTLEKYIIMTKISKVKELLIVEQSTITEIAAKLNYYSIAHLSNQFKKYEKTTITEFKKKNK